MYTKFTPAHHTTFQSLKHVTLTLAWSVSSVCDNCPIIISHLFVFDYCCNCGKIYMYYQYTCKILLKYYCPRAFLKTMLPEYLSDSFFFLKKQTNKQTCHYLCFFLNFVTLQKFSVSLLSF